VTGLLNAISGSRDTKLMAGTLDTVMQWTIENPTQAEILASQDTGDGATGYRNALTSLLDKSFNQFVALHPSNPSAKFVRTMQLQTIADLQVLSAVVMGPPYDSEIAGNFAEVFGTHAMQFAEYAVDPAKFPQLDSLLAGGGDLRHSAAVIFGQLMKGFDAGLHQSQASFQAQAHDAKAAADLALVGWRVFTDFLRGVGTGMLLVSAWFPGGLVGVGAGEKLVSVIGRVGLFSGSIGTMLLDSLAHHKEQEDQAKALALAIEEVARGMRAANATPTRALRKIYEEWYQKISDLDLPGTRGQKITYGVMDGSSFAATPSIETENFFHDYNPLGYYFRQTGYYPPVR
jgi:hypothetical protein